MKINIISSKINSQHPNLLFHMKVLIILFVSFFSSAISAQKSSQQPLLDSVFNYICSKNILYANIVMKQAILETGWLKSEFLMSRNNLFGFRSKNYLKFNTWQESVDYYKTWQDKYYTNPKEDYYKFLVRIKYAFGNYPSCLQKIIYNGTCNNK